jgi:hypothetical protein
MRSDITTTVRLVAATTIAGNWRIVEMELWDRDAIDLIGPAHLQIGTDGSGTLRFIAVEGVVDGRRSERDGRPAVEFSWAGVDECDQASGRGWAVLESDGTLRGRIFIHGGDDSAFRAHRDRTSR